MFWIPKRSDTKADRKFAFLASTMKPASIADLRARIAAIDRDRIWIAERDGREISPDAGWSPLDIVDRCLDEIDAAERFFFLVGSRFGTSVSIADRNFASSFTELELFYAVANEKPVYVFQIEGESEATDLLRLVEALSFGIDEKRVFVGSPAEITERVQRLLDIAAKPAKATVRPRRLLSGHLASARHRDFANEKLFQEIEFLKGEPVGVLITRPDLDLVRECLTNLKRQTRTDRKMSRAWLALRLLMGRHYRDERDDEVLALWEEALKAWSQFAGWRGLHSHIWLGHIASLGSLRHVRDLRGRAPALPLTGEHGDDLFGAFASVYYSLAKSGASDHKASFMSRSLAYLEAGLVEMDEPFKRGLYSIRGAIRLYLQDDARAVADFEEALRRVDLIEGNSTTHAMLSADLGFAEWRSGRRREGRRRLEQAVTELVASEVGPGFKARALRKLAIVRLRDVDPFGGFRAARDAGRLIEEHGLPDQTDRFTRLALGIDRTLNRR